MKVGHGYDVHRLTKKRNLILCGVQIPYKYGLLGHSDADVAIHALIDAMLGAASLGDIGKHFPDTDSSFLMIESTKLLSETNTLIKEKKLQVSNLDLTIIAQSPKIANYIDQMKKNLSKILYLDQENINIKATTEEGLGFTGRKKGISAHCVVLLKNII